MLLDIKYFLNNQTKENRGMWISRFYKIYDDYIKTNGKEILLSQKGFYLITYYETDFSKESDVLKFMLNNNDKFKTYLKDPKILSYFWVSRQNRYIETLAKKGQIEYKEQLERIKGDLSEPYKFIGKPGIDTYELLKKKADALYFLYSKKDESTYISLMQEYFDTLKDLITKVDYNKAIDELFVYNKAKVSKSSYKACILWINTAMQLKGLDNVDLARYYISMGQCYQGLKNNSKAKECYSKASIMAIKAGDKRLQMIARELSKSL